MAPPSRTTFDAGGGGGGGRETSKTLTLQKSKSKVNISSKERLVSFNATTNILNISPSLKPAGASVDHNRLNYAKNSHLFNLLEKKNK